MRHLAIAIVVLAAIAGIADAQRWRRAAKRVQAGGFLHYELTGLTMIEDHMTPAEASELVLAGARLHGFLGDNASVAYHVGLDLGFGSTIRDGGFAYDVALFPVGAMVRFGKTSIAGFGAGIGAIGAIGTIDDAVTVPVEALAEIGGGRLRVIARARVAYVAGADSRQSAAPSIPFADELDAMVGLRIGRHHDGFGFPTGNGYFVGVSYRELAGARFAGITIGYSIDGAMPRRWVNDGEDDGDQRPRRRRRTSSE
jgi:hypothetical protein